MDLLVGMLVLVVLPLWLLSRAVVVVPAVHVGVVRRFGAYHRQVDPGLRLVIPFVERVRRVDARVRQLVLRAEPVIAADNLVVLVDCEVDFMVTDALKACRAVEDHDHALANSVVAGLREAAARMPVDELRTRLDGVAWELTAALPPEVAEWGLRALDVRVSESPPEERRPSMSRMFRLAPPPS